MAKLGTMIILLVILQGVLLLYSDSSATGGTLWEFASNTNNWNTSTFIGSVLGISLALGLTIYIGAALGFITDFIVFAAAVGGLISLGGVVFVNLRNAIMSDLNSFFQCTSGCAPANWIATMSVGIFAVYYIWCVIEWWRGKDV